MLIVWLDHIGRHCLLRTGCKDKSRLLLCISFILYLILNFFKIELSFSINRKIQYSKDTEFEYNYFSFSLIVIQNE